MIKFKLGKKSFQEDKRDLKMATYLMKSVLPPIPEEHLPYQNFKGDWQMFANDQLGDCVFAGCAHETLLWVTEGGKNIILTDDNVIKCYEDVAGYNPNDPSTDQGTNVRDALKYRQSVGILDSNGTPHKIDAFLKLNNGDIEELKAALFLFDAVGIGIQFPESAMSQFENGQPWDVIEGDKVEGGHYISCVGIDKDFIYVVTWGKIQKMTYAFYNKYADEVWAILSEDFLNSSGKSPDGFDLSTLKLDLQAVKSL